MSRLGSTVVPMSWQRADCTDEDTHARWLWQLLTWSKQPCGWSRELLLERGILRFHIFIHSLRKFGKATDKRLDEEGMSIHKPKIQKVGESSMWFLLYTQCSPCVLPRIAQVKTKQYNSLWSSPQGHRRFGTHEHLLGGVCKGFSHWVHNIVLMTTSRTTLMVLSPPKCWNFLKQPR